MVPESSYLIFGNLEVICEISSRRNSILCYSYSTIHIIPPSHVQTMPMNCESFIKNIIYDLHIENITRSGLNGRAQELPIDEINSLLNAIWRTISYIHTPLKIDGSCSSIDVILWMYSSEDGVK